MGRVMVELTVINNVDFHQAAAGHLPADKVRQVRVPALVDTGANWLVLPEAVVTQLGLPSANQPVLVRFADGRIEFRDMVDEARVELCGRHGNFSAVVEPNRTDAIIGAIVMEQLDLLVDCSNQTLHPRDPNRVIAEIGW
jgi:predicted aspartyl protease